MPPTLSFIITRRWLKWITWLRSWRRADATMALHFYPVVTPLSKLLGCFSEVALEPKGLLLLLLKKWHGITGSLTLPCLISSSAKSTKFFRKSAIRLALKSISSSLLFSDICSNKSQAFCCANSDWNFEKEFLNKINQVDFRITEKLWKIGWKLVRTPGASPVDGGGG